MTAPAECIHHQGMNYFLISDPDHAGRAFVARLSALHKRRQRVGFQILQSEPAQVSNLSMQALPADAYVIWLRADENAARPDWAWRVDLVLDKRDLSLISNDELLLFGGFLHGPHVNLDGVATLEPAVFDSELRLETWVHRQLGWGVRWIELRSDLLSDQEMRRAADLIPESRLLWSVRDLTHADRLRRHWEKHRGDVDWPLDPNGQAACWVEPRFISMRSRARGAGAPSIQEMLAQFPRVIEAGTQLHAEFTVDSLEELLVLEKWRRDFPIARVINPVSRNGRWNWSRLLRGADHPLSYYCEVQGLHADTARREMEADRPSWLAWARRRRLQKRERRRFGHVLFAAQISQINENFVHVPALVRAAPWLGEPIESHASGKNSNAEAWMMDAALHAEFFARFAAPLLEVKLMANELRCMGLQNLSQLGLRWAQLDSNLAQLEGANTWVCDNSTYRWSGKWIDPSVGPAPFQDPWSSSPSGAVTNGRVVASLSWPARAQQEFWQRLYEDVEE